MAKHLGEENTIPVGSEKHEQYVRELADDIKKTKGSYYDYVQQNASFDDSELTTHIDFANRMYTRMILANVLRPLSEGISKQTIKESLLTYAGVCLTNKAFRDDVRNMRKEFFSNFSNRHQDKRDAKIYEKFQSSEKFRKNVQNIDSYPITATGAAHMHIAWTTDAFDKMRESDADIDQIMADYNTAVDMLHKRCERYGISVDDVNAEYRAAVTDLMHGDPHNATYFDEISVGNVASTFDENDGTNKHAYIDRSTGEAFTGYFGPRKPISAEQHVQFYKNLVKPLGDTKNWAEVYSYADKMDMYSDFLEDMRQQDGVVLSDRDRSKILSDAMPEWAHQKQTAKQEALFVQLSEEYNARRNVRKEDKANINNKTSGKYNRADMFNEQRREYYKGSMGNMGDHHRRMPDDYADNFDGQDENSGVEY